MAEQQEQAGSALSGRSKSARARETARGQIRKAKAAMRRQFLADRKIRIVMEGMRGEEPVSVVCPCGRNGMTEGRNDRSVRWRSLKHLCRENAIPTGRVPLSSFSPLCPSPVWTCSHS